VDKNITNINRAFSDCLAAIISTRVVLLQLLPGGALLSVYALATSSAPLFVSKNSKLYEMLSPPIILDPFKRAKALEPKKYSKLKWLLALSAFHIFITQSRWIQYAVQLSLFVLSIAVLFTPQSTTMFTILALVLVPFCIAQSLALIIALWKALGLTDDGDEYGSKRIECIQTMEKRGLSRTEIVAALAKYSKEDELETYVQRLHRNPMMFNPSPLVRSSLGERISETQTDRTSVTEVLGRGSISPIILSSSQQRLSRGSFIRASETGECDGNASFDNGIELASVQAPLRLSSEGNFVRGPLPPLHPPRLGLQATALPPSPPPPRISVALPPLRPPPVVRQYRLSEAGDFQTSTL